MSDYVSLEEVKHSLELTGLTFADNELSLAITAASRGVDEYCGRTFFSGGTADLRYYSPYDHRSVSIDDLVAVVAVDVDYDGDGTFETSWTQNVEYLFEPLNAPSYGKPWEVLRPLPYSGARLSCFQNSLRITGQWGWDQPPAAVKQATSILASRLMRRTREAAFGVVGIGFDNAAVRIPSVDPDVRFLLEPYLKGGGVLAA